MDYSDILIKGMIVICLIMFGVEAVRSLFNDTGHDTPPASSSLFDKIRELYDKIREHDKQGPTK